MLRTCLLTTAASVALLAGVASAADTIGAVSALNRDVDGTPPTAETRKLLIGDDVFVDELIESSPIGSGQFLFLDQTSLTIAKNSSLVLDKYVYDPETKSGEFTMTMTRGVLRFVGGRITKKTDAVVVTPTATIGIRGGMAIIIVDPDGTTRVMHIAGEYTRVSRPGDEPIVISRSNGMVEATSGGVEYVGVAPQELVAETARALIGRDDAGEEREPVDTDVVESGMPKENSEAKGASTEDPISTTGESAKNNEREEAEGGFLRNEEEITTVIAVVNLPNPQTTPPTVTPPAPPTNPPVTPPVTPPEGPVLLPGVTGSASFSGSAVPGLTSGGGGQSFVFTQVFEGSRIGLTADDEAFIIPVSEGFFAFDATEGSSPIGGIAGAGFHDSADEFTFAAFQTNVGVTGAFLTGLPSAALPNAGAGQRTARTYAISEDFLNAGSAQFAPNGLAGRTSSGVSALTLLSNKGGSATGGSARAVAGYLEIGDGGKSTGFGVFTATVAAAGAGTPSFADKYEGYYRDDSGTTRVETRLETVEDGVGGSAFGAGAKHLAISNNADFGADETTPGRAIAQDGTSTFFGSSNSASRTSVAAVNDSGLRVLAGYASVGGVDLGNGQLFVGRSRRNDGFSGDVDAATNSASAILFLDEFAATTAGQMRTFPQLRRLGVQFGDGDGRSAAIDERTFAMRDASDGNFFANGVPGDPASDGEPGQDAFRGALATASLVGDGGIFPAGVNTSPAFMEWGWWAGEFRADPEPTCQECNPLNADQRFHLGAWVAGDLTASANMPLSGTASYDGFAVVSAVDNGQTIVDGARFEMTYEFSDRFGTVEFTDLLGADPVIAVNEPFMTQGETRNRFEGSAGINIDGRDGLITVDGSFFNGAGGAAAGAAGGSIGVGTNDGTLVGAGVFAGDRVPGEPGGQ